MADRTVHSLLHTSSICRHRIRCNVTMAGGGRTFRFGSLPFAGSARVHGLPVHFVQEGAGIDSLSAGVRDAVSCAQGGWYAKES